MIGRQTRARLQVKHTIGKRCFPDLYLFSLSLSLQTYTPTPSLTVDVELPMLTLHQVVASHALYQAEMASPPTSDGLSSAPRALSPQSDNHDPGAEAAVEELPCPTIDRKTWVLAHCLEMRNKQELEEEKEFLAALEHLEQLKPIQHALVTPYKFGIEPVKSLQIQGIIDALDEYKVPSGVEYTTDSQMAWICVRYDKGHLWIYTLMAADKQDCAVSADASDNTQGKCALSRQFSCVIVIQLHHIDSLRHVGNAWKTAPLDVKQLSSRNRLWLHSILAASDADDQLLAAGVEKLRHARQPFFASEKMKHTPAFRSWLQQTIKGDDSNNDSDAMKKEDSPDDGFMYAGKALSDSNDDWDGDGIDCYEDHQLSNDRDAPDEDNYDGDNNRDDGDESYRDEGDDESDDDSDSDEYVDQDENEDSSSEDENAEEGDHAPADSGPEDPEAPRDRRQARQQRRTLRDSLPDVRTGSIIANMPLVPLGVEHTELNIRQHRQLVEDITHTIEEYRSHEINPWLQGPVETVASLLALLEDQDGRLARHRAQNGGQANVRRPVISITADNIRRAHELLASEHYRGDMSIVYTVILRDHGKPRRWD